MLTQCPVQCQLESMPSIHPVLPPCQQCPLSLQYVQAPPAVTSLFKQDVTLPVIYNSAPQSLIQVSPLYTLWNAWTFTYPLHPVIQEAGPFCIKKWPSLFFSEPNGGTCRIRINRLTDGTGNGDKNVVHMCKCKDIFLVLSPLHRYALWPGTVLNL